MRARNMSPADLARATNKDQGIISRLLRGERQPRPETLADIARALKLSVDEVYRAAGLLPPRPDSNIDVERAEHLVRSFKTDQYRQIALATLETLLEQEERAAVNAVPRPADQAP